MSRKNELFFYVACSCKRVAATIFIVSTTIVTRSNYDKLESIYKVKSI